MQSVHLPNCILLFLIFKISVGFASSLPDPILIEKLQHLEIRGEGNNGTLSSNGISLSGIPKAQAKTLARDLRVYIGTDITESGVAKIGQEIVSHCEGNGLPVVNVFLPEQAFKQGHLVMELEIARVGTIAKEGRSRLDDATVLKTFGLSEGDTLFGGKLQAGIDRLNENPFRKTEVLAAAGTEDNEADLLIRIEETRPWQFFAGADNAGSLFVEEDRLFAGVLWGDALGLDHQLSYQFTSSPTGEIFTAHSALWKIPLPWNHWFVLQGSISEVELDIEDSGIAFGSEGNTWDLSARYEVPLFPRFRSWKKNDANRLQHEWRHKLFLGFEYRSTDNDVTFGGQSLFASTVETAQFVFGYEAAVEDPWGKNFMELRYAWSPGGITGANSDSEFDAIRAGATANYSLLGVKLTRAQRLPANFSLMLRAGAQWTDDLLLSSEQFAIGGHSTVRGLSEREFLADKGYWASAELRLPPVEGICRFWKNDSKFQDRIQCYGFFDHAYIDGISGSPEIEKESFLSGGIGLRWKFSRWFNLRLDHGWIIEGESLEASRTHIGLTASF